MDENMMLLQIPAEVENLKLPNPELLDAYTDRVNMNCAYSAAGLILMAGHRRYCMPRSQVLIHSGSAQGIGGNFEDIQESTKSYKKMVEEMREFIVSKTKIDKALMKKNQSRDWYLDTTQQTELGVVDEIIIDLDVIL